MSFKKNMNEWLAKHPEGIVPAVHLRALIDSNVYGDALTERIVRCVVSCNEFANPDLVPGMIEMLGKVQHSNALLADGVDQESLHEEITMDLQRLGRAVSRSEPLGGAPAPHPAGDVGSTPAAAPEASTAAPTAPAAAGDDVANVLFGEPEPTPAAAPPPPEEEPPDDLIDGRFKMSTGAVVNVEDVTTGEQHVHIAGTAICLAHGHNCAFAQTYLKASGGPG